MACKKRHRFNHPEGHVIVIYIVLGAVVLFGICFALLRGGMKVETEVGTFRLMHGVTEFGVGIYIELPRGSMRLDSFVKTLGSSKHLPLGTSVGTKWDIITIHNQNRRLTREEVAMVITMTIADLKAEEGSLN